MGLLGVLYLANAAVTVMMRNFIVGSSYPGWISVAKLAKQYQEITVMLLTLVIKNDRRWNE
jgi:hypothetical protein